MPLRALMPAALAAALLLTLPLRLLAQNWERDPTFTPPVFESYIPTDSPRFGIAPLADGRVLVAKDRHFANGRRTPALLRINADGSIDPGFSAAATLTGVVRILLAYPDGRVLVTDDSRQLFRLLSTGALDPAFAVTPLDAGFGVNAARTPTGRVWIWGTFRTGATDARLALLKADGGWDERFPILDLTRIQVNDALVHSEEALTVAATSSLTRATLFRITASGAIDATFDASSTFPGTDASRPEVIARQADGSLIAAGSRRAWRILPG
ncbi:MAG TPA: delta-60 repeat domain-containing protein, partial [Opitutaceae bacterium]